jgi:protein-tyrosine phosphatase
VATAPSGVVETGRLVSRILDQLATGRTVVIHCFADLKLDAALI